MNPLRRLMATAALCALVSAPLMASAQQLTVSAAASLTEAFREIGTRFEARKPGAAVRFNFAASGVLIQQIVQGAPVDVFVSADQETMDRGVKEKVLDAATRRDFAGNTVVMVAPAQGAAAPATLGDLAKPEVKRIAIGKPATVPVGRYTKQVLDTARLWEPLEPKLVYGDSVRQVLDYVARGEVEAGFVYRTDAELMKDKVRVLLTAQGHTPVTYPAAVVSDSRQAALAREFVSFLSTAEAQGVLARYGFSAP